MAENKKPSADGVHDQGSSRDLPNDGIETRSRPPKGSPQSDPRGLMPLPELEQVWLAGECRTIRSEGMLDVGDRRIWVLATLDVLPRHFQNGAGARGHLDGVDQDAHMLLRTNSGILSLDAIPMRLIIRSVGLSPSSERFTVVKELPT